MNCSNEPKFKWVCLPITKMTGKCNTEVIIRKKHPPYLQTFPFWVSWLFLSLMGHSEWIFLMSFCLGESCHGVRCVIGVTKCHFRAVYSAVQLLQAHWTMHPALSMSSFSFPTTQQIHKESLHCPQRMISMRGRGGHSYYHQMNKTPISYHPLIEIKKKAFKARPEMIKNTN